MDEKITVKDHSPVTFVLTTILALTIPFLGAFSLLLISAAVGAGFASSRFPFCFAAIIPGGAAAWFSASFFETSSPAALTAYVIAVIVGLVVARSAKKHDSALAQILKVSSVILVIFTALGGALIYSEFGSVSDAAKAYGDFLSSSFARALEQMTAMDTAGNVANMVAGISTDDLARSLVLLTPGIALGICTVSGWLVSLVTRPILSLYGRNDLRPMPPVILLPVSAAVIFLVTFALSLFSSGAVYYVAQNLLIVLQPAFVCVGVTSFRVFARRAAGGKVTLLVILAIVLVMIQPVMLIYTLCAAGLIYTFKRDAAERATK